MASLRLVATKNASVSQEITLSRVINGWFDELSQSVPLSDGGARALLQDAAFAVADLCQARRHRVTLSTDGPWQIGLERRTQQLCVSVFVPGADPVVLQPQKVLNLDDARQQLRHALVLHLNEVERQTGSPDDGLFLAQRKLSDATIRPTQGAALEQPVRITSSPRHALSVHASLPVMPRAKEADGVTRSELLPLLSRGTIRLAIGAAECELKAVHIHLWAELLIKLAERAVAAKAAGTRLHRQAFDVSNEGACGIEVDDAGLASLLIKPRSAATVILPSIDAGELARAFASFGRRLAKAVCEVDGTLSNNLRLTDFRQQVRALAQRVRPTRAPSSELNQSPESYRAFAASDAPLVAAPSAARAGRLRYAESWRASVPNINIDGVMLGGERLYVASATELGAIDRNGGGLIWSRRIEAGHTALAPQGIAHLSSHGQLTVFDLEVGDQLFTRKLQPAGPHPLLQFVRGAGVPPTLLVTEGSRHLTAIDVLNGEVRWRRTLLRRGKLHLRRAGRLLVVGAGTESLLALDVLSGEQVWRYRGPAAYTQSAFGTDGTLVTVGLEGSEPLRHATVTCLDAWSGAERWSATLPRRVGSEPVLQLGKNTIAALTEDGCLKKPRLGVTALSQTDGSIEYDLPGGLCEGKASTLVYDDLLIANGDRGELVAMDLADGRTRYRHVFASSPSPADRPHHLAPILRSGALFLPQSEVYVVRPHDGSLIGHLPPQLIPDRLQVDERCGVYVAEASGHLVAYHALPSLSLVRPA